MNALLLKKLKENTCSDEELYEIYRWLSAAEKEEEVSAFIHHSWQQSTNGNGSEEDVVSIAKMKEEVWKQISNGHETTKGVPDHDQVDIIPEKARLGWVKWAAVVALLLCAGVVLWQLNFVENEDTSTLVTFVEKSNPRGQKSTIFLHDGSKVILNSSSSIRYASDFGEGNRDIELSGEAFFEVAKNPQLPFRVMSKDVTTTALGTSFNVSSFPEKNNVQVSLLTGKTLVEVSGQSVSKSRILQPGQFVSYNRKKGKFDMGEFQEMEVVAWKEGVLYFKDQRFKQVIDILEEWYDVDITIDYGNKNIAEYGGINGEFRNQSLENVLKVMKHSKNFDYILDGKKLNITLM